MTLAVKTVDLNDFGKWGAPIVHGEYTYYFPTPGGSNSNGAPLPDPTTKVLKFHAPSLTWSFIDLSALIPAEYPKIRFGSAIKVTRVSGSVIYVMPDRWPYVLRLDLNDDSVTRIPINVDTPNGTFVGAGLNVPYGFPQETVNGRIIAACRGNPATDLYEASFGLDWTSSRLLVINTANNTAWTIGAPSSNRFVGSTHHAFANPNLDKVYFMPCSQGSGYNAIAVNTVTLAVTRLTIPPRPDQTSNTRFLGIPAIGTDGNVYGKLSNWVYKIDPTQPDTTAVSWVATNATLASMQPAYENSVIPTADGKIIFLPGSGRGGVQYAATRAVQVYDIASNTVTNAEVDYAEHQQVRGAVAGGGQLWSINHGSVSQMGASFLPNGGPITFYPWVGTGYGTTSADQPSPPQNIGGRVFIVTHSVGTTRPALVRYIDTAEPPTAVIVAVPLTGTVPLEVAFDGTDSVSPGGLTLTYAWDFGDGATSTSSTPTHTYLLPGTYTVTLTVTNTLGQTDTDTVQIAVAALRKGRRGLGLVR